MNYYIEDSYPGYRTEGTVKHTASPPEPVVINWGLIVFIIILFLYMWVILKSKTRSVGGSGVWVDFSYAEDFGGDDD